MSSTEKTPYLEMRGITKSYLPGKPVLDDLNLSVDKGEIFGIIGPNGSGKTTLLRLLSGFLEPDSGRVALEEVAISQMPPRKRAKRIAFVPQESHVVFPFSVMEVVLQGRYPYLERMGFERRDDLDKVRWALEVTETFSLRNRLIGDLSGGERQRVILARALAQEPEIILLDEPTSFLDIKHQVKIHELLSMLNRDQGLTVISVLHDLTMASTYFNRLCLLFNKKVESLGRPEEVIQYERIKRVYDTEVYIDINSVTGRPYIIPLGRNMDEAEP